jgi:hypothetical protein
MRPYKPLPPYPMSVRVWHDPATEANDWMRDATDEIERLRQALEMAVLSIEGHLPNDVILRHWCRGWRELLGKPDLTNKRPNKPLPSRD